MIDRPLIIGSRGSDLALWQANHIKSLLQHHYPALIISIEVIHTSGDKILDSPLSQIGGKGVFTKEIEQALLDKKIDLAVHSMKDLPTEMEPALTIAAVPERADVQDVFLAKEPSITLAELPPNAVIATGSLRRKSQLLTQRSDFQIVDIRGNVPTRIKKLLASEWHGMILAAAGVERLGLTEYISHKISTEWVLPAVGQGALAVQVRSDDAELIHALSPLNDTATLHSVTAERALLRTLGGGCQVPIGAHATVMNDVLNLTACIAHPEGSALVRAEHSGPFSTAETIGQELAKTLLENGGKELLEQVSFLQSSSDELRENAHPAA